MSRLIESILRTGEKINIPVERKFLNAVFEYPGVSDKLSQEDTNVLVVGLNNLIIPGQLLREYPHINLTLVNSDPQILDEAGKLPYFNTRAHNLRFARFPDIALPPQKVILGKGIFPFLSPNVFARSVLTEFLEPEGLAFASGLSIPTRISLYRGVLPYERRISLGGITEGSVFVFRKK